MGLTKVKVTFCGRKSCEDVEAIVDTASTNSAVTEEVAERIDLEPRIPVDVKIPKGVIKLPLSMAKVTLEGYTAYVPVYISDKNTIGLTTLEVLGFKVDPVTGRLEKTLPIMYLSEEVVEEINEAEEQVDVEQESTAEESKEAQGSSVESTEEECKPCVAAEALCSHLPEDKQDFCKMLIEKIKSGEIDGKTAALALQLNVGWSKFNEAREKAVEELEGEE